MQFEKVGKCLRRSAETPLRRDNAEGNTNPGRLRQDLQDVGRGSDPPKRWHTVHDQTHFSILSILFILSQFRLSTARLAWCPALTDCVKTQTSLRKSLITFCKSLQIDSKMVVLASFHTVCSGGPVYAMRNRLKPNPCSSSFCKWRKHKDLSAKNPTAMQLKMFTKQLTDDV